jgi:murein DD-endopeptidase MepM/ murein hydrolase activator NlpD
MERERLMAITTTRAKRADRGWTVCTLAALAVMVSVFQFISPTISMAQGAGPAKKQVTAQRRAAPKPQEQASPTDTEADSLNERWLTDFNKTAPATPTTAADSSAAPTTAAAPSTPAAVTTAAAPLPVSPAAVPTVAPSVAGTETERTLSAPTQDALPGAGARVVVPGTITLVKADSAAAAFNSMPGGANQPIFKDLNDAFSGFAPTATATAAKVEVMQARTIDGSSRPIYASIGSGKNKQAYWWFSPPDQPEGWFDEQGKRLGGAALSEPKPGARISSPFGTRRYYGRITSSAFHNGIDFEAKTGEPIYAAADGVVNHANWYYNYGRTVKITHGDNFETLYAHMSRIAPGITPGTVVHRGDVIGFVGSTGRATGPHLHFSTIIAGKFVDPAPYLSEEGGHNALGNQDLVAYRQWQQDVRAAAVAQKPNKVEGASFWSRNPFNPPPAPGQL